MTGAVKSMHKTLAEALAAFQARHRSCSRGTRLRSRELTYKYVDLAAVMECPAAAHDAWSGMVGVPCFGPSGEPACGTRDACPSGDRCDAMPLMSKRPAGTRLGDHVSRAAMPCSRR